VSSSVFSLKIATAAYPKMVVKLGTFDVAKACELKSWYGYAYGFESQNCNSCKEVINHIMFYHVCHIGVVGI
jgi:hypothetical protein